MIQSVTINNFKSVRSLTMNLGRVNVVIGENGCGKTNVLEAIAFASAAGQGLLTPEILGRKMRLVPAEFMVPAFADVDMKNAQDKIISIDMETQDGLPRYIRAIYDSKSKEWINAGSIIDDLNVVHVLKKVREIDPKAFDELTNSIEQKDILVKAINSHNLAEVSALMPDMFREVKNVMLDKPELDAFVIYNPEENKLRQFSDDTMLYPLGRNGEGLFQYLKEIHIGDKQYVMASIVQRMTLLDWFDGVTVPDGLLSNEYRLQIGDRYLKESLHYFDQRSTNEGFLYLLFYMTLFSSPDTPLFFAIDNIESAFNPKLCTKIIQTIVQMAKDNNKQVILTTHSPYVLDGLDLTDDEQRLFVVKRNKDGHTTMKRIPAKNDINMRLSEVWMKGMIGGLPDNF